MIKLKVGDRLYIVQNDFIYGIETIERLTKTQAISFKGNRFKRQQSSHSIRPIGIPAWSKWCYKLENEDLIKKYKIQNLKTENRVQCSALSAKIEVTNDIEYQEKILSKLKELTNEDS